jgi:O-antigen/teichoic acid export membrane protein
MRGVYPNILKTLKQNEKNERNKKEHTEELLSHAVRFFLLITVPAVIGISILSPVISKILDPLYTEGSSVIIWVSIGMFFLGLTEYNNKAWELTSSTGVIFRNSMLCCLFNIISNLILIRFFGYTIAAVNTAIAYFLYFLLSFFGGRKILKWHLSTINYIRIFGSATLMGVVLYIMTKAMPASIWMLIILVPAGMAIYGISLYLTGEIKTEVKQLAAKLRDAKYGT